MTHNLLDEVSVVELEPMYRSRNDSNTPQYDEGMLVRWQVEPDLFGKIVHVDEDRHVVMVEIHDRQDGSLQSTGFTINAGYSDLTRVFDKSELGESNVDQHIVAKDDWVQWYPETGPQEAHGKVQRIDEPADQSEPTKAVVRMYKQDDDGNWHPTDHTRKLPMSEVEGWGNYPTDDAISSERLAAGSMDLATFVELDIVDLASNARKSDGSGESKSDSGEFDESTKKSLKNKVEEHNDEHGDEDGKKVTYTMLKNVYERGLGAYQDSHRPGMTPNQWAMARVNAFLYLVRNGNPENDNYTQDNDLLPDGHGKSGSSENATGDEFETSVAILTNADSMLVNDYEELEDDLDGVYSEWDDHVNMTASELYRWAENPCAKEASVDPKAVIERNLHLLETPKSEWGESEINSANRTISFISRMKGMRPDGDAMDGVHGCPTDWAISLLNWAFNPFDSVPNKPSEGDLSEKNGYNESDLNPST